MKLVTSISALAGFAFITPAIAQQCVKDVINGRFSDVDLTGFYPLGWSVSSEAHNAGDARTFVWDNSGVLAPAPKLAMKTSRKPSSSFGSGSPFGSERAAVPKDALWVCGNAEGGEDAYIYCDLIQKTPLCKTSSDRDYVVTADFLVGWEGACWARLAFVDDSTDTILVEEVRHMTAADGVQQFQVIAEGMMSKSLDMGVLVSAGCEGVAILGVDNVRIGLI